VRDGAAPSDRLSIRRPYFNFMNSFAMGAEDRTTSLGMLRMAGCGAGPCRQSRFPRGGSSTHGAKRMPLPPRYTKTPRSSSNAENRRNAEVLDTASRHPARKADSEKGVVWVAHAVEWAPGDGPRLGRAAHGILPPVALRHPPSEGGGEPCAGHLRRAQRLFKINIEISKENFRRIRIAVRSPLRDFRNAFAAAPSGAARPAGRSRATRQVSTRARMREEPNLRVGYGRSYG
jgi:hypothetical protein